MSNNNKCKCNKCGAATNGDYSNESSSDAQKQMETQSKMQIEQAKSQYEVQKLTAEKELKLALMAEEFAYNMQLKGQEQSQIDAREREKEDGKSKRISQQSTQTSKMIEQKKRDLPAIDFESNEDSLDGFDMAEFDPR